MKNLEISNDNFETFFLLGVINGIKKKFNNAEVFLKKAIKGIENLISTYSYSNNHTITQTLALYKNLLEMENDFSVQMSRVNDK
mgnify:CR=1 FL=1